jgi:hypothetical protein
VPPTSSRLALVMRTASNKPSVSTNSRARPLPSCRHHPTRGPPLGGLDRWAVDADGRRGLTPRVARGCSRHAWTLFPMSRRRATGHRDWALGSTRGSLPLAATPVEREHRMEYLLHVHRARGGSPVALLGRWDHRSQYRPLLVRQIGRIFLSMPCSMNHSRALLC